VKSSVSDRGSNPPDDALYRLQASGIRINLGLPSEISVEVRNQFEQMWQELIADIRQCGVCPFLDLYRRPVVFGISAVKAEYPLDRWGPLLMGGLICVNNPQQRFVS